MTSDIISIRPAIMCGGAGTRLWPMSRQACPKQFSSLFPGESLFQQTVMRTAGSFENLHFRPPLVITAAHSAALVEQQLSEIDARDGELILEPVARNTATCAAVAALVGGAEDPGAMVLLAPSDHLIADRPAFHRALIAGAEIARDGQIITFGATPTAPETGYGYIRRGVATGGGYEIHRFVEKPDRNTAESYLLDGGYYWNAGIFLFRADVMIAEFERHAPDILACARAALAYAGRNGRALALDAASLADCPSLPIDVAVMEKTDAAAVIPISVGWSDVGSWSAVWDHAKKDAAGNSAPADAVLYDAKRNLVRSDGALVALLGVEDLVVVVENGVVMVARREDAQNVKIAVETLKAAGRNDVL